MIDCQSSRRTKRWQRNRKRQGKTRERGGGRECADDRTNNRKYAHVRYFSKFSINPADTKSLVLSLSLGLLHGDMGNRTTKKICDILISIHMYRWQIAVFIAHEKYRRVHWRAQGGKRATSTILPSDWSNQSFRRDHNISSRLRHRLSLVP